MSLIYTLNELQEDFEEFVDELNGDAEKNKLKAKNFFPKITKAIEAGFGLTQNDYQISRNEVKDITDNFDKYADTYVLKRWKMFAALLAVIGIMGLGMWRNIVDEVRKIKKVVTEELVTFKNKQEEINKNFKEDIDAIKNTMHGVPTHAQDFYEEIE